VKITKISLQGFRAFDEPFELDLADGKNLLVYGENGSGKSSIYFALKRFFEERGEDIAKHRNHFSPAARDSHVRLHIKGKDAAGNDFDRDFEWNAANGHPLPVPIGAGMAPISAMERSMLVDGAHRAGFLDYRMMLRTHLIANPLPRSVQGPRIHDAIYGTDLTGLDAQVFDLVTQVILSGVRVTTAGGTETTIGELIRRVWRNWPRKRYKYVLSNSNRHANTFKDAFNAKLPELEVNLAEFLNHFENHQLSIKFQPVSLAWDKTTLELKGAELIPEMTFRGQVVADHHQFLNEARLSAIAVCLFLAGVRLSDNDYGNPAYSRLIVLDDALIGLDLQNRLPILSILTSEIFKNYQIFLFTHDRVWYELARGHLTEKTGWLHRELIADEDTGHLIPKQKPSKDDLDIAKQHLANGDLKAAAVYARSAFESKLRAVCEKNGIKVPFKSDSDKVTAGALWDEIVVRQRDREKERAKGSVVPDFVTPAMETGVATMRSTVLNRLSHAGASGLVHAEVGAAIKTVEGVIGHDFPKRSTALIELEAQASSR
jgi:energy-coupling factor transporter ATP-binding protein EcfA2